MTALLAIEPRVEEKSIHEPAVGFAGRADELHNRPGVKCCCWDLHSRIGTDPTTRQ